jgi:hypothetical protein
MTRDIQILRSRQYWHVHIVFLVEFFLIQYLTDCAKSRGGLQ